MTTQTAPNPERLLSAEGQTCFWQTLRRQFAFVIWLGSWLFLAIAAGAAILLHWAGDSSWITTLLAFGPRWIVLLPLAPLAPLALLLCRRGLLPLVLAAVVASGPVMGFRVPWRALSEGRPPGAVSLRVVTFNVGGVSDSAGLVEFLRSARADVFAFQEWPNHRPFPEGVAGEWHTARRGELLVASRYPILDLAAAPRASGRKNAPAIRCDIDTPAGTVHFHCLHLYTLRKGLDAVIARKWKGASELERVSAIRNEESSIAARFAGECEGPAVVLGDFNMPADSVIFGRDWGDWQDAFAMRGFGFGYSFTSRRIGLRIDHVLADASHWQVASCDLGPDLAGQHRPVIAELLLLESP
jgi:endonuclease/exonuclease/phosphatase (EEP) superfamily protein YafD